MRNAERDPCVGIKSLIKLTHLISAYQAADIVILFSLQVHYFGLSSGVIFSEDDGSFVELINIKTRSLSS